MTNPALGTKRRCADCGAPFYDLGREPIVCPKCGAPLVVEPVVPRRGRAVRPARTKAPVAAPIAAEEEQADGDAIPVLDADDDSDAEAETEASEPEEEA